MWVTRRFTVGGFTQPAVARGLIEHTSNIEKGLCQRFMLIAPCPTPTPFAKFGHIDPDFSASIGESFVAHMPYLVITVNSKPDVYSLEE